MVQWAEAGDGGGNTRSLCSVSGCLLARSCGRGNRSVVACCRLILFCLDNFADHTEHATDNIAHSHLSRLGGNKSSTDVTDARDEGLCIACTFTGNDTE